jgi:putative membrane protein insertion efficiency factor
VSETGAAGNKPRRFRRLKQIAAALLLLLCFDWLQAPSSQLSSKLAIAAIDAYQATLSKAMPSLGVRCRLEPSCSHYAEGAMRCQGLPRGAWLAVRRILRCGPWTPLGTIDPPPCGEASKKT